MKVKKYIGDNIQDTIFKVKVDLGSDAIILDTRKFTKGGFLGFFGQEKVEVLAGIEEKSPSEENTQKE
ncbi:MAG TPA: flagellar biosynthesis protein FlhF, partial [Halanaerobiales bacterium]|nr:flagellar biosynthesis protein FlhF [Halanaerobiales bacterium]